MTSPPASSESSAAPDVNNIAVEADQVPNGAPDSTISTPPAAPAELPSLNVEETTDMTSSGTTTMMTTTTTTAIPEASGTPTLPATNTIPALAGPVATTTLSPPGTTTATTNNTTTPQASNHPHPPPRIRVQVSHPSMNGNTTTGTTRGQPRVLRVNHHRPNAGEIRLDLGRGNVVTVPLQRHSPYQQHTVNISGNNNNNNTGATAAASPTVATNSPSPRNVPIDTNSVSNIPPVARTFTTTPTIGGISGSLHPHNVNIRVAHLHALVPQPIADSSHTHSSSSTSHDTSEAVDEESLARFKCPLCYEFMKDPVGCPSETCSSRFCFQCLRRAAQESQSSSATPYAASQKPKCPTCRVEFAHMVRDETLKQEMFHGPTVACRHEGCPEQQLKLPLVQEHESHCAFEKVRCRYSSFGCPWIGTRGQVAAHEAHDCALDKVKVLVDKFRKLEMDHSNRLSILQQQNAGSIHMLQVYRQNAQRDLLKSTTNLFDLCHYCHVITCSINHFFQTKDRWQTFYRSNEGRATVTNFLVLLPTVLLCGLLNLLGIQSLFIFLFDNHRGEFQQHQQHQQQPQPASVADIAMQLLLEDSVVGMLLGMLTILLLLANFADTKSSVTWGHFSLPRMGDPPVMCDIIAVSIFTMHIGILEYYGAEWKSMVVWILLALASTIYPAVVLTISHAAARGMTSTPSPTPGTIFAHARSLEPVVFGLRFSLVASYFGVFPTMDAAAICVLTSPYFSKSGNSNNNSKRFFTDFLVGKNCFLDSLPKSFLLAYLGAKAALLSVQFQNWNENEWSTMITDDESLLWSLAESSVAFVVLLTATVWVQGWLQLGILLGQRLARQAEPSPSARPDGSRPPVLDYQLLGLGCFGAWVGVMGTLLLVR